MEYLASIGITDLTLVCLIIAAFAAGFIDSIAGGGGLINLPALLIAGVPPHFALGTTKFVAPLGTTAAFITYARSNTIVWKVVATGIAFSLLGSAIGAKIVLIVSNEVLGKVLVFLLPIAVVACMFPVKQVQGSNTSPKKLAIATPITCLLIGFYDGFFGPGTGSFLLIALHLILGLGLVQASATAKPFNLASGVAAFVVFAFNGSVIYTLAIPLAIANIAGNILGSKLTLSNGAGFVRKILMVSLSILFITLIQKYYF